MALMFTSTSFEEYKMLSADFWFLILFFPQFSVVPNMVGNISGIKSNIFERYSTGPNLIEKILFLIIYLYNGGT